tara:strand:- start:16 stop:342 length:327 start_codon:yes stop_codon:yes gene_type:complete
MATLKTSDSNFEVDVMKSSSPVIVDFWAEWCGPCLQIAPVLEDISEERKDVVKIYKINIDENPLTPQKYGVRGIPTLILFKDGKVFDSKIGSLSKSMLNEWINTNLNI